MIELICAISLILVVFAITMNIYSYTINTSIHTKSTANTLTEKYNLGIYLKKELENDNVNIISISSDNSLIEYEKIFVEKDSSDKKYLIQNKKLQHNTYNNNIVIVTKNTYYKKNKNIYTKMSETTKGTNILIENVKNIKVEEKEGYIIINLVFLDKSDIKTVYKIKKFQGGLI